MQIIFSGICFFGAIAAILFVKTLDLNAGLTVVIVSLLVFLVVYSLARIPPKTIETEKDPGK